MICSRLVPALLATCATLLPLQALHAQSSASVRQVTWLKSLDPLLPAGIAIPAGRAVLWTSGTPAPLLRPNLGAGAPERFGDTRTQALGALKAVEQQLMDEGLTLRDVVHLRVYLVGVRASDGRIDVSGWNAACADLFGTPANPSRPAQSIVGVPALTNPDWLVEVEAVAVYPR